MGLLIMLAVVVTAGWLASWPLGPIGGVIVSVVTLVGWFLLNKRSGTTGLFRANVNSYFAFRRHGQSVEEALKSMVEARYAFPFQKATKARVLYGLSQLPPSDTTEKARVTSAVFLVFCTEQGILSPPAEQAVKYFGEISTLYDTLAERHGFASKGAER